MNATRIAAATAALMISTALITTAMAFPAAAQQQLQDQTPAPPKPYKPVAIAAPTPLADPGFEAFRKQVGDIAKRKDKAALGKLVAKNFFWEGENGDSTDKKKAGVDNLAAAIGLNEPNGAGWEILSAYVSDPTADPLEGRNGVVCGPAGPKFDMKALEALAQSTDTDISEWAYPIRPDAEIHSGVQPDSPVTEKLGGNLVRVYPDVSPASVINAPSSMRIVLPSGKTGYVAIDAIAPLVSDQMCYAKEGDGWKIAGFVGVGDQQ